MFDRLTDGRLFVMAPNSVSQDYHQLAQPTQLPDVFRFCQTQRYTVTPGDLVDDIPVPTSSCLPCNPFRSRPPVRKVRRLDDTNVEFRWLPYDAGKITCMPLAGGPVWSGPFTGCWFVIFRLKANGQRYVAHLGKDGTHGAGTRAIAEAWIDVQDEIEVISAYNPCFQQLEEHDYTAVLSAAYTDKDFGGSVALYAGIAGNDHMTFATRGSITGITTFTDTNYKMINPVRLRDQKGRFAEETGRRAVGDNSNLMQVKEVA